MVYVNLPEGIIIFPMKKLLNGTIPHFQTHPERFPWCRAMVILASQTMIDHDDPLLTTMVTILDYHHCN
jgi:hypothetical protein